MLLLEKYSDLGHISQVKLSVVWMGRREPCQLRGFYVGLHRIIFFFKQFLFKLKTSFTMLPKYKH